MSSLTTKKITIRFRKNTFPASKKAPGCPQKSFRMLSKKITDALRKAPAHTCGHGHLPANIYD